MRKRFATFLSLHRFLARKRQGSPNPSLANLSAASTWQISVKHGLGRLPLPGAPETYVPGLRQRHGIEPLALNEEATLYLRRLPTLHRDPFDRMLVCQAIVEGMVILTPDELITQYTVRSMW